MLRSMPMKFQNINPMTTLSTLTNTLTMIKTFALDLDMVACNECSILPSIWFLIYPILPGPPTCVDVNKDTQKLRYKDTSQMQLQKSVLPLYYALQRFLFTHNGNIPATIFHCLCTLKRWHKTRSLAFCHYPYLMQIIHMLLEQFFTFREVQVWIWSTAKSIPLQLWSSVCPWCLNAHPQQLSISIREMRK